MLDYRAVTISSITWTSGVVGMVRLCGEERKNQFAVLLYFVLLEVVLRELVWLELGGHLGASSEMMH